MNFKIILYAVIFLSLPTACVLRSGLDLGGGGVIVSYSKSDDVRSSSSSSSSRSSQRNRSGRCEDDKECRRICYRIYDEDGENEAVARLCEKLSASTVYDFVDIVDALEDPYDYPLDAIEEDSFEEFLDLSRKPWVDIAKGISRYEYKEEIFTWMAKNPDIIDIFINVQKNREVGLDRYEGVKEILDCRTSAEDFFKLACSLKGDYRTKAEDLLTDMGCKIFNETECILSEAFYRRIEEEEQRAREEAKRIKRELDGISKSYRDRVFACYKRQRNTQDCVHRAGHCADKCDEDDEINFSCSRSSGIRCGNTQIGRMNQYTSVCKDFYLDGYSVAMEVSPANIQVQYSKAYSEARCESGSSLSRAGSGAIGGTSTKSSWVNFE